MEHTFVFDGYLHTDSTPLLFVFDGYLFSEVEAPPTSPMPQPHFTIQASPSFGGGASIFRPIERKEKPRRHSVEDDEIITIIKLFLHCQ